ncbi:MAG: hypothetical protein Q8Q25_00370 [bacterium]|nr:hypothetical protein [bacterium]
MKTSSLFTLLVLILGSFVSFNQLVGMERNAVKERLKQKVEAKQEELRKLQQLDGRKRI